MEQLIQLYQSGKLSAANKRVKKLLKKNPNSFQLFNITGAIQMAQGKLDRAVASFQQAINVKSDYSDSHYNLGIVLSNLGKFEEAIASYKQAIKLNTDHLSAHNNLGNALSKQGKYVDALNVYSSVLEKNPEFFLTLTAICSLLEENLFTSAGIKFKKMLTKLLVLENISHKSITKNILSVLSEMFLEDLVTQGIDPLVTKTFIEFANDELVLLSLQRIIFSQQKWELYLTRVRSSLCNELAEGNLESIIPFKNFLFSLSEQCFLNEYVYTYTNDELKWLSIIESKISDQTNVDEIRIALIGCYKPLSSVPLVTKSIDKYKSASHLFNDLVKLQVRDQHNELKLMEKISSDDQISDTVSIMVKRQYESNPYPRWRFTTNMKSSPASMQSIINEEIYPNKIDSVIKCSAPKILLAGCGTGEQVVFTQRYMNASILAVDLSLSSLCFAKRKTDEMKIDNVNYLQSDILHLHSLQESFDVVLCTGVLHHMHEPSAGMSVLVNKLKPGGFMKIGLYSELARSPIVKMKDYIKKSDFAPSEDSIENSIRKCRQVIFEYSDNSTLNNILNSPDFYTLSSCRDLLFHAQEHRFTINQLSVLLNRHHLKFLGFLLPKSVKSAYGQQKPKDTKMISLSDWQNYEESQPGTFGMMYQFWVQKPLDFGANCV